MSKSQASHDEDIPRFEPWLGVLFASFMPVMVALFVPHAYAVPLIALTVLLFVAGLVMLRVQSQRRARERASSTPPPQFTDRLTADAS
jgi:Flp pilus assembly protein TadB